MENVVTPVQVHFVTIVKPVLANKAASIVRRPPLGLRRCISANPDTWRMRSADLLI